MAQTGEATLKATKTQAQQILSNVPEEKVFLSRNGQVYKNLYELQRGLDTMVEETYEYHTGQGKNDFSTWVREVIGDEPLARDLENTANHEDAAIKVESRIHYLISR